MKIKILFLALLLSIQPAFSGQPKVGSKAHDFTLKSLRGKTVSLHDLRGKVVFLDFWASWCGPCREEMPYLAMLQKIYGKEGFRVVAVNIDNKQQNAVKFLQKLGVKLPALWDEKKQVVKAYDVDTMPTSFLLDITGRVRFVNSGFRAEDFQTYKKQIEQLLKEKSALSYSQKRKYTPNQ